MQINARLEYFLPKNRSFLLTKPPLPFITAHSSGNLMRFMQCLPEQENICKNFIDDGEKLVTQIATANVRYQYCTHNEIPIILFKTTEVIKKNQQLGFFYGPNYFPDRNIAMQFFNQNGHILDYNEISFYNKGKFNDCIERYNAMMSNSWDQEQSNKFLLNILKLFHRDVLKLSKFDEKLFNKFLEISADTEDEIRLDSAYQHLADILSVLQGIKAPEFFPDKLAWKVIKSNSTGQFIIASKLTSSLPEALNYYIIRLNHIGSSIKVFNAGKDMRRIVIEDIRQVQKYLQNKISTLNSSPSFIK